MSYLIHDLNNHGFRLCLYTESSNGLSNFLFLLATEQACLWWGFLLLVGCVISLFGGERRGGWCSKWRVQYVEGAQHPGRCPVPGKVCRLCNCSAAALWVWGAQTSWCVLSSPVRQIAGVLWAALHVLEWWLPGITKNPSPTCSIAVIEQKVHKKIAEALALKHAGAPALPNGGEVQCSLTSGMLEHPWIRSPADTQAAALLLSYLRVQ